MLKYNIYNPKFIAFNGEVLTFIKLIILSLKSGAYFPTYKKA